MTGNTRMITKITLAVLFLFLMGCANQPPVQKDSVQIDLVQIEKQAATDYEQGNWLQSEKNYSMLAEQYPHKSLNWLRLGNIYAMTNRPDAAVIAYREAVKHDPELSHGWYNLGVLQLRQAAHSFNQMQIHVSPDDPVSEQSQRILDGIMQLIQGTPE